MDLTLALLLVVLLSALGIGAGRRMASHRRGPVVAVLVIVVALLHTFVLSDALWLARWLPWKGLVFWDQLCLLPLMVFFLMLLWPRLPKPLLRRLFLTVPLALLTLYFCLGSITGQPPETSAAPPESDGVVRQTSDVSCSAASAATLLASASLPATETQLASLCRTRSAGTPMLGVYRGLRERSDGTLWRVQVLAHASLDTLRKATQNGPVLISVGLGRWQRGYDPRYTEEWGWTPGKRHAVVVFGFLPGDKFDKGDPSVGREQWNVEALNTLWNGEGIQLIRR